MISAKNTHTKSVNPDETKRGSSVVGALVSSIFLVVVEVPGSRKISVSEHAFPYVSFAGMTLDKCAVLRIVTLTRCPLCRESHPLCRLKNPTVI